VAGVTQIIFPVSKPAEWKAEYVRAVDAAIRDDFGN
jgi:hypothetical protein